MRPLLQQAPLCLCSEGSYPPQSSKPPAQAGGVGGYYPLAGCPGEGVWFWLILQWVHSLQETGKRVLGGAWPGPANVPCPGDAWVCWKRASRAGIAGGSCLVAEAMLSGEGSSKGFIDQERQALHSMQVSISHAARGGSLGIPSPMRPRGAVPCMGWGRGNHSLAKDCVCKAGSGEGWWCAWLALAALAKPQGARGCT